MAPSSSSPESGLDVDVDRAIAAIESELRVVFGSEARVAGACEALRRTAPSWASASRFERLRSLVRLATARVGPASRTVIRLLRDAAAAAPDPWLLLGDLLPRASRTWRSQPWTTRWRWPRRACCPSISRSSTPLRTSRIARAVCSSSRTRSSYMGALGVSAVPMSARVVQVFASDATSGKVNLLMPAMGPNVAGVIGTAIAAGVFLTMLGRPREPPRPRLVAACPTPATTRRGP
jgi:hypothetical protein